MNFAHGELLTVSAYVIYGMRSNGIVVGRHPGRDASAVVLSMLIELVAFRRVRSAKRSPCC
ncbi:MAG: hypothetical protein R2713_06550 [Ilumatobacteraceae bacterium]